MLRVVLDIPKAASETEFQKLRTEPLHIYARSVTEFVELRDTLDYVDLKSTLAYINANAITQFVKLEAANVFADPTPPDRWVNDTIQVTGDSVVFVFSKGVSEVLYATDVPRLFFGKAAQDAVGMFDLYASNFRKSLSDSTSGFSEEISFAVGKVFADQQGLLDAISRNFGKSISDSQATADSARLSNSLVKSDEAVASESSRIDFSSSQSDVQTSEDYSYLDTSKALSENILLADGTFYAVSIHKEDSASASDETFVIVDYSRSFSETEYVIDESTLEFGKNESELMTAADSGFARMTDYADISYFAEDYVGTSFYF